MIIFNILMFAAFSLMMVSIIAVQVYFIPIVVKEFIIDRDFAYLIVLVVLIGTSLAAIALVISVFTGVVQ